MRWLVLGALLYVIAPGHPGVPLAGVPLGQTGAFLLTLLLTLWAWLRGVDAPAPRQALPIAIGVAVALKIGIAAVVPTSGWIAEYYANDQFKPPVRRSVDFRDLAATRIDRQLSFAAQEFPVHFFNDPGFNFGFLRENTEAFSVQWRGFVRAEEPLTLAVESRGAVALAIDGASVTGERIRVEPGDRVIEVRYQKPKDTEGLLRVRPTEVDGATREWRPGEVTPVAQTASSRSRARLLVPVAWLLHATVLAAFVFGAWPFLRARIKSIAAMIPIAPLEAVHHCVMPVVIVGLTLQGLWKARHLVDRVWTLTGGDDWLAFEMGARDVLFSGLLMPRDAVPGAGGAYFEYPGYIYFLSAIHWLTGESLAGVILANFLALALATVTVYYLARLLTTPLAALGALALLLVIEQLDFVRYYTVTLLSENLYFLMVALTVYLLARHVVTGKWMPLCLGALAGGFGAATRPTMMLFLPVAMIVVVATRFRIDRRRAFAAAVVLPLLWFTAISPFTYRNYVMSGKPVLITDGQAVTFVRYNLPKGDRQMVERYTSGFDGSNLSALRVILWVLSEHPAETLTTWGTKIGFGLGMVHWLEGARTPHPELVITSVLYLAALLLLRDARSGPAWLAHGFIFTHLATLLLTMPSNYGYRMVLSMYLLMVIFAAALIAKPVEARWLRRAPAIAAE